MKIEIGKYFTLLTMLAVLVSIASLDVLASVQEVESRHVIQSSGSDFEHDSLVKRHENIARELQAKVREQEEMLELKPRSSFFGKNEQHIKSRVAFKIRRYEQAAQENLEKAAYHRKIAETQTNRKAIAKPSQVNEKINKAKKELDDHEESL